MSYIEMPQGVNRERLDEDLAALLPNFAGTSAQQSIVNGVSIISVQVEWKIQTPTVAEMKQSLTILENHNPALQSSAQAADAAALAEKSTLKGQVAQIITSLASLPDDAMVTGATIKALLPFLGVIENLI